MLLLSLPSQRASIATTFLLLCEQICSAFCCSILTAVDHVLLVVFIRGMIFTVILPLLGLAGAALLCLSSSFSFWCCGRGSFVVVAVDTTRISHKLVTGGFLAQACCREVVDGRNRNHCCWRIIRRCCLRHLCLSWLLLGALICHCCLHSTVVRIQRRLTRDHRSCRDFAFIVSATSIVRTQIIASTVVMMVTCLLLFGRKFLRANSPMALSLF